MNEEHPSFGDEAVRSTVLENSNLTHALPSFDGNESSLSMPKTGSDDARELFDISPIVALELLCENIDKLAKSVGELASNLLLRRDSASDRTARKENEPNTDQGAPPKPTELYSVGVADHMGKQAQDEYTQQSILVRRFLSKKEPPISLKDYLLRLHRFCPMSTAVYLATSVYITKIVAIERILPVTPKIVHRLVLAGLRVAVKALEDLSYSHSRFAKVGGVSARELSRLEIGFCFLVDFELRVDSQILIHEARSIRSSTGSRRYSAGSTHDSA